MASLRSVATRVLVAGSAARRRRVRMPVPQASSSTRRPSRAGIRPTSSAAYGSNRNGPRHRSYVAGMEPVNSVALDTIREERGRGFEPLLHAWKARVLPLHQPRVNAEVYRFGYRPSWHI